MRGKLRVAPLTPALMVVLSSRSAQAKRLGTLAKSFAKTLKLNDCELSLSLVRDPAIRKLKRRKQWPETSSTDDGAAS